MWYSSMPIYFMGNNSPNSTYDTWIIKWFRSLFILLWQKEDITTESRSCLIKAMRNSNVYWRRCFRLSERWYSIAFYSSRSSNGNVSFRSISHHHYESWTMVKPSFPGIYRKTGRVFHIRCVPKNVEIWRFFNLSRWN